MKRIFPAASALLAAFSVFSVSATICAHDFDAIESRTPFGEFDELKFLKTGDPLKDWNPMRRWTSGEGKHLEGKLLDVREFSVAIEQSDGTEVNVPLFRFSEEDKRFIDEWRAVSEYFNLNHEPGRKAPSVDEADIDGGTITSDKSFHETRHFRLESDVPIPADTMRHLCKVFEATYYAMELNPIGLAIAAPKEEKFQVRLFYKTEDFHAAGGREESGGTYLSKERVILVPLEMTGLTDEKYVFSPQVLIHETTHALSHQWLNGAPIWFIEGFAEYMASIPYDLDEGRLDTGRLESGIRREILSAQASLPKGLSLIPPEELVTRTYQGFMGEPELEDTPIEIPPIMQPIFQLKPDSSAPPPVLPESPPTPGALEDAKMMERQASHYISSLLLVHHLIESGQISEFRKFLFDVVKYRWDATRYLETYQVVYEDYANAINQQIGDYNKSLRRYHEEVEAFQSSSVEAPVVVEPEEQTRPEKPDIPVPLRIPDILSQPRTPEELSPFQFPGVAAKRHLELPESLSLEPFL